MKALIRKDWPWLGPLSIAALVATIAVAWSSSFASTWIMPDMRHFEDLQHPLWVFGLVAGVVLALRDPISRTEDLLVHRAVDPVRAFDARAVAGLLALAALLVAVLLAAVVQGALDGHLRADLVEVSRAGVLVAVVAFAAANFAVALYALSLPIAFGLRAVALGLTWLPLALAHGVLGRGSGESAPDATLHTLVMLAVTAFALLLARRLAGRRADPDHAIGMPALHALLLGVGPALALSATLGVSALQEQNLEALARVRPFALSTADGGVLLVRWADRDHRRLDVLDDERNVVRTATPEALGRRGETHAPAPHLRLDEPFDLRYSRAQQAARWRASEQTAESWVFAFDGARGEIGALVSRWDDGSIRRVPAVVRGDGTRFSAQTRLLDVYEGDHDRTAFALDWSDGSAWRVAPADDGGIAVTRTPLPDGDRAVATAWLLGDGARGWGVAGERATYRWDGRTWSPTEGMRQARGADGAPIDALAPTLVATRGDGSEFSVVLAPRGFVELALASVAALPGALRPLPLALWTAIDPVTTQDRPWLQDPVLADRAWLLSLPLLGTALALWFGSRRLRRLGTDRARGTAWRIALVLFGPVTLLALRAVETERAHRRHDPRAAGALRITAREPMVAVMRTGAD